MNETFYEKLSRLHCAASVSSSDGNQRKQLIQMVVDHAVELFQAEGFTVVMAPSFSGYHLAVSMQGQCKKPTEVAVFIRGESLPYIFNITLGHERGNVRRYPLTAAGWQKFVGKVRAFWSVMDHTAWADEQGHRMELEAVQRMREDFEGFERPHNYRIAPVIGQLGLYTVSCKESFGSDLPGFCAVDAQAVKDLFEAMRDIRRSFEQRYSPNKFN
jgi:hypothetical protein